MYQKESVYNSYVDSKPGRDYHYKLTSYLEDQASLIQTWIYDVVTTLVWTCNSRQDSGERCPLCGWETLVQIQAVATTLQDLLNKAALKGTDPYALTWIHRRSRLSPCESATVPSPGLRACLWGRAGRWSPRGVLVGPGRTGWMGQATAGGPCRAAVASWVQAVSHGQSTGKCSTS